MKSKVKTGIINYKAGNVASVRNAFLRMQIDPILVNNLSDMDKCEKIIFPGVGHAQNAMNELIISGLGDALKKFNRPVLGICLGMQLLGNKSKEGDTDCLNIGNYESQLFHTELKVPHMGWNKVHHNNSRLFEGIEQNDWFYFVHSYFVPVNSSTIATTNYGTVITSAIQINNYWGVQFHPEKSGKSGLRILQNFMLL